MIGLKAVSTVGMLSASIVEQVVVVIYAYPDPEDQALFVSKACGKQTKKKGDAMKKEILRTHDFTSEQLDDLDALRASEPDLDADPPAPAENWAHACRLYRPRKEAISLRLDADVLDWLRRRHERYQPEINRILRERMEKDLASNAR